LADAADLHVRPGAGVHDAPGGDVGLGAAREPAEFVERPAFGVASGGNDGLVLFGRDGPFLLEPDLSAIAS